MWTRVDIIVSTVNSLTLSITLVACFVIVIVLLVITHLDHVFQPGHVDEILLVAHDCHASPETHAERHAHQHHHH